MTKILSMKMTMVFATKLQTGTAAPAAVQQGTSTDYLQILSPIINFLYCPTSQAWIDEACKPKNLSLLLTDHMVRELKTAQNAMLLMRRYVADKADADELLACLKPYGDFTYRWGSEPDLVALHKRINESVMPQTDDPWGRQLLDSMTLLTKEELHHFWQMREMMLVRDIPYVKITASNYARGMRRGVHPHEPVMLIDKLVYGAYTEIRLYEHFATLASWLDDDLQKFCLSLLHSEARYYQDYLDLAQKIVGDNISEQARQLSKAEAALVLRPEAESRFHSGVLVAA